MVTVSFKIQFPLTTQNCVLTFHVSKGKGWDYRNLVEKVNAKEIDLIII